MLHFLPSIQGLVILPFILGVIAKFEALPPTPGEYLIQNAESGMLLSLSGGSGPESQPNDPIVEYPVVGPILQYQNQIWVFSPEASNIGTIRAVSPPSFMSCPTIASGSICTGNEEASTLFGIVGVAGGYLIQPAQGLALTGTGEKLGQVFLSPVTGAINQVWVFVSPPATS